MLDNIIQNLNNREIAFLIILCILFLIIILTYTKGLIQFLSSIFKTFKFITLLLLFNLYVYLIITFLTTLLDTNLIIKDLFFWAISSNFLLFKAINLRNGFKVKNLLFELFSIGLVVEFFVHFDSYSIPIEFFILTISIFLLFQKIRKESKGESVIKINLFFSLVFIILLTKSAIGIFNNSTNVLVDFSTQVLLLPTLSIILLPILYLIHVYVIYDSLYIKFRVLYLENERMALWNVIQVAKISTTKLLCIYQKFNKFDYSFAKSKKQYLRTLLE